MKSAPYRAQFAAYVLAMMADNIEHVISYWVVFQKFHSPALAGFAVLSHWLPFLLFSVAVGSLADRFDPRRIIQCGMLLFIVASAGWGIFFITDTLQMWHAMLLLVIHGCAGVLWQTPNQLLLYDIVGPANLPSAVRLNATARYLGILVGPAVGGVIMLALGPSHGIIFNTLFYLPDAALAVLGAHPRQGRRAPADPCPRPCRHRADRPRHRHAAGPDLDDAARRTDLLHDRQRLPRPDAGFCRSTSGTATPACPTACCWPPTPPARCLRASRSKRGDGSSPNPRTAIVLAILWSLSLLAFASVGIYTLAIALLFAAGFFELSFNTMAQALVQINAPAEIRGRVVGLFRHGRPRHAAFSGITVGLAGAAIGIHWSLGLSAAVLLAFLFVLYRRATTSGLPKG